MFENYLTKKRDNLDISCTLECLLPFKNIITIINVDIKKLILLCIYSVDRK